MSNIKNKSIIFGLGIILAIFALNVVSLPTIANANYNVIYGPGTSGYASYNNNYPYQVNQQTPIYVQNQSAPVIVTNPTPTTQTIYSNATNPNQTNTSNVVTSKAKVTTKTTTNATTTNSTNSSNLSANTIFGLDNFMPSNLIQWILFIILIMLIVILVRKIYGGKEKYNSTPLKHE